MSTLNAIQPFLILPVIYLTRGIDFNEGSRMLYLRAAFVAVHLAGASPAWRSVRFVFCQGCCAVIASYSPHFAWSAVMGVMMLLRQRIEASGKATQITVKAAKSAWAPSEEPEERKMSEKDYDMEQWNTLFKGTVTQLLILGAIHWKWEVTVPLLSQVLMSPLKLYGSEVRPLEFAQQFVC